MSENLCVNCEKVVDDYILYCETCYQILCLERKNRVLEYKSKGKSFKQACKLVADEYDVDIEDVEFLFE